MSDTPTREEFTKDMIASSYEGASDLSSLDALENLSSPPTPSSDGSKNEHTNKEKDSPPSQEAVEHPAERRDAQLSSQTALEEEKDTEKQFLPLFLYPNELVWKRLIDDIKKDEYYRSKRFLSFLGSVEQEIRQHWYILLSPFMTVEDKIYALGASRHPKNSKKSDKNSSNAQVSAKAPVRNTEYKNKTRAAARKMQNQQKSKKS